MNMFDWVIFHDILTIFGTWITFFHLFNMHVFTCIVTVIQTQLDGLYEYGKVIISLMLGISL